MSFRIFNTDSTLNYKAILLLFIVSTVIGAMTEHINYKFFNHTPKRLANPILTGFPIYGLGAVIAIVLYEYIGIKGTIIYQFILFSVIFSIAEMIYGVIVGAGPNSYLNGMIKHWDYSDQPFNFRGLISLELVIMWGIAGVVIARIYPLVMNSICSLCK